MTEYNFDHHRPHAYSHITTGLSKRQLVRLFKKQLKSLQEDDEFIIAIRTEKNDPMQYGP